MWITFCGAAGTVTGSCYLVDNGRYKFLVDCGMFQGSKELRQLNRKSFLFNPAEIDFVLLTHSHVDHSGLLPLLWKQGFKGAIHATKATAELCKIVLPDSGHIQEQEAEWRNRKKIRTGAPPEQPLYSAADALSCCALLQPQHYNVPFEPAAGIRVNFRDAGHILGSAITEVWIDNGAGTEKIVFSGDLGQNNQPIIRDPEIISAADYLLIESTYGNRLHEEQSQRLDLLRGIIHETYQSGGNLIIPAFAVGRTQDLLYHLKTLFLSGAIPRMPVYIDSPMAVSVTEIYRNNPDCYDEPTRQLFEAGESPFEFQNLHFIRATEESKQLNQTARGSIIISANGMCEAGRILHHLKHNLWKPQSHILFVGYQAEGTLGRRLLEGAKVVKIMGEEVSVQARIHSIGGFSAHADQNGLLTWLEGFRSRPRGLFIIHGENGAQQDFAATVRQKFGWETFVPKLGERFELTAQALLASRQQPSLENYAVLRKVTDLEHAVLNLRTQIRTAEPAEAKPRLDELKRLLTELEDLMRDSA
jgi:metallo-beta-lactamase family protein